MPPPKGWAPSGAGLTYTQLRLIGQVITTWAVLEVAIQHMLFTLAQAPDVLGQALTEDLGPDHRLKALDQLCRRWLTLLRDREPDDECVKLIDQTQGCVKWTKSNKDLRNRYAHWWWSRISDDQMSCHKYTLKAHAHGAGEIDNHAWVMNNETEAFANEISERTTEMLWLLKMLQKKLPTLPHKPDGL